MDDFDNFGVDYTISQHPPVKEGYVRLYEDHTGRYYKDVTEEEYEALMSDSFLQALREETTKELDTEIIDFVKKFKEDLDKGKET